MMETAGQRSLIGSSHDHLGSRMSHLHLDFLFPAFVRWIGECLGGDERPGRTGT